MKTPVFGKMKNLNDYLDKCMTTCRSIDELAKTIESHKAELHSRCDEASSNDDLYSLVMFCRGIVIGYTKPTVTTHVSVVVVDTALLIAYDEYVRKTFYDSNGNHIPNVDINFVDAIDEIIDNAFSSAIYDALMDSEIAPFITMLKTFEQDSK